MYKNVICMKTVIWRRGEMAPYRRNRTSRIFIHSFWVGLCDHGVWQIPRFAGLVNKLKTQESQWCSSCPKASSPKTQEEPAFQLNPEGKKKPVFQFKDSQAGEFSVTQERITPFVQFRPSTASVRSIYTWEGNLLYSVHEI